MTEKRFRLAEHLLETRPWDLFFMVEMGTDRIHHGFWRFTDSRAPAVRARQSVRARDARLLPAARRARSRGCCAFADDDTAVLVVSDHGAKRMDGGICVNEWLRREGYLVLREEPSEPTRLTPDLIDWSRTVAWGEGGYYCRLFLNVDGREPEGVVSADDYERVRSELKERLEALGDDQGRPIGTVAHRPEDLYAEARGIAPDLLVYFGDLYWRSVGLVGTGTVHVFENDTGPDDANHAHEGLYMLVADGVPAGPGTQRAAARRRAHAARAPRRARAGRDGGAEHAPVCRCGRAWVVSLSRRFRHGHAYALSLGSKVGGGAGWPQGEPRGEPPSQAAE